VDELLYLSLEAAHDGTAIGEPKGVGATKLQPLNPTDCVVRYAHLGELTARYEVEVRSVSCLVEMVHWCFEHRLFLRFPTRC